MGLFGKNTSPVSVSEQEDFLRIPRKEPCIEALEGIVTAGRKRKGAVLKIYLEDFKTFNDTFGYDFGELFLLEISRFLTAIKGAAVFRITGVEFIVILEGQARSAVDKITDSIIDRFDRSWHLDGMDCMCSVSIGMCWFPGYADTPGEMLSNLSHAVAESAVMGQNILTVYNSELMQKILRKNSIARKLPDALAAGHVELCYRPTWHMSTSRFVRADCYIRMRDPEFGLISAQELISIAEHTGQIGAVSQYAIRRTCELIARLIEDNREFETIAVPISPIQFLQESFFEDVENIIRETGIPASRLALEVTEIMSLSAFSSAQDNLSDLSGIGVEIVLTEFGTGFSGLSSILSMPVDVVKLDRMLIWQVDNDPRGAHVVEGLIYIAKKLGKKLIAEGVETEYQYAKLKEYGCEYEQGFYYSPTLAVEELVEQFAVKGQDEVKEQE